MQTSRLLVLLNIRKFWIRRGMLASGEGVRSAGCLLVTESSLVLELPAVEIKIRRLSNQWKSVYSVLVLP